MSREILAGIDIGGTKCAVSLASIERPGQEPALVERASVPTPGTPETTLATLVDMLDALLAKHRVERPLSIGVCCGGPLSSARGLVLSPPNLPGWDRVDVLTPFARRYGVATALENDANAGALAEWLWGGGRGLRNIVFLTFGTGMGAGLILDGRLYRGTNDLAGEVGHVRLAPNGPVGFGKVGSFEGFCSGGGIARLAQQMAREAIADGKRPAYCPDLDSVESVNARTVAEAAAEGDGTAREVMDQSARMLGRGLALIVDVINPEKILIGSVYVRQQPLFDPQMLRLLRQEAIPESLSVCAVEPAGLGERVGDLAALGVAANAGSSEPDAP